MGQMIAKKLGIATVKFYNVSNFSNIYSSAPKPYDFAPGAPASRTTRNA